MAVSTNLLTLLDFEQLFPNVTVRRTACIKGGQVGGGGQPEADYTFQ